MKNITRFFSLTALIFFSVMVSVAAGEKGSAPPAISAKLGNPLGSGTLVGFLEKILKVMVDVGWPILVLAIVYTGFLFVKAQGKPAEIEKAKTAFLWTVVGGMVLLGASILATAISGTINTLK